MGDKERLNDGLISQKHISSVYNTYASECVNPQLRNEMLSILKDEHEIQADLFTSLQSHGWYQVEQAEATKLSQARQKYTMQ
jgi:spore coat protein CotF